MTYTWHTHACRESLYPPVAKENQFQETEQIQEEGHLNTKSDYSIIKFFCKVLFALAYMYATNLKSPYNVLQCKPFKNSAS